jgi:hypothetical protein
MVGIVAQYREACTPPIRSSGGTFDVVRVCRHIHREVVATHQMANPTE